MPTLPSSLSPHRTRCDSLLHELRIIWDEIGETDNEMDKMLLELEQECLDIYRRKIEATRKYQADLKQSLAAAEAEIANLLSALGEDVKFSRLKGTLKEQLASIKPVWEDLKSRRIERIKAFSETQMQIARISAEISGNDADANPQVDECDLTMKRLGELNTQLKELQHEKGLRLQKVTSSIKTIHDLSLVMSIDFSETINGVHPNLAYSRNAQLKSISNDTIARLTSVIQTLREEKQRRMKKLQGLASTLTALWNLIDTPREERRKFDDVISLVASSVDDISSQGCLALEVIEQTEIEVERLNELKASKMKELVFKRHDELEEIYRGVHMDVDNSAARQILTDLIESGNVNLSELLSSMDDKIARARDEALSRKDILDKIEKWQCAVEEEKWLDEYEKDENRYSAGRGAHKNLKRAEKARILVSKIPFILENLTAKVRAWDSDNGTPFLYDKAPVLQTLEEYAELRKKREEQKRKSREQKRLQEQFAAEQEALYGAKPSIKKPLGLSNAANSMFGTPKARRLTTNLPRSTISSGKAGRESKVHNVTPINYVALSKDD